MDKAAALLEIFDETVEVLEQTPEYVTVYDLQEGRDLIYRVGPMDEAWLESRIHYSPDIGQPEKENVHDALMWVLRNIDPNMLLLLQAAYVVTGEGDEAFVTEHAGVNAEELPDNVLEGECIGLMWWFKSSVFINLSAIQKCVRQECEKYCEWWRYDQTLYEAARVDGAGRYHVILHIEIPSLLPTFFVLKSGADVEYEPFSVREYFTTSPDCHPPVNVSAGSVEP